MDIIKYLTYVLITNVCFLLFSMAELPYMLPTGKVMMTLSNCLVNQEPLVT